VAQLKHYPEILLEKLKETTSKFKVTIVGIMAETVIGHRPNVCQQRFRLS
jgi:hypothetical protein